MGGGSGIFLISKKMYIPPKNAGDRQNPMDAEINFGNRCDIKENQKKFQDWYGISNNLKFGEAPPWAPLGRYSKIYVKVVFKNGNILKTPAIQTTVPFGSVYVSIEGNKKVSQNSAFGIKTQNNKYLIPGFHFPLSLPVWRLVDARTKIGKCILPAQELFEHTVKSGVDNFELSLFELKDNKNVLFTLRYIMILDNFAKSIHPGEDLLLNWPPINNMWDSEAACDDISPGKDLITYEAYGEDPKRGLIIVKLVRKDQPILYSFRYAKSIIEMVQGGHIRDAEFGENITQKLYDSFVKGPDPLEVLTFDTSDAVATYNPYRYTWTPSTAELTGMFGSRPSSLSTAVDTDYFTRRGIISPLGEVNLANPSDRMQFSYFLHRSSPLMDVFALMIQGEVIREIPADYMTKLPMLEKLGVFVLSDRQTVPISIPQEIGGLTNLKELNIVNGKLTQVPRAIANLGNLERLSLQRNNLRDLDGILDGLISLEQLYLDNNSLQTLPSGIGNLRNLKSLFVGNNQISVLPSEMANLVSLTGLDIQHNQISEIPKEVASGLISLRFFYASYNRLDTLPVEIALPSNRPLEEIDLRGNFLDTLPEEIAQLQNIKVIRVTSSIGLPSAFSRLRTRGILEIEQRGTVL